MYKL